MSHIKRCYECDSILDTEEQLTAQSFEEKIIYGDQRWSELYSGEFVHLTGDKSRFYVDGSPVVCLSCVLAIGKRTWDKVKEGALLWG